MASSKAVPMQCENTIFSKKVAKNVGNQLGNYGKGRMEIPDKENVSQQWSHQYGSTRFPSCSLRASSNLNLNLNVRQMKDGANKTVQTFKTTIDSLSQKFRRSTRRRHRLGEGPAFGMGTTVEHPSPVKMYSPFRIDTPSRRSPRTLTPRGFKSSRAIRNFDSPSQNFRKDVEAVSRGTRQLSSIARGIVQRNSLRK